MIGNALGLWMLSALAVFLLIYLRRPKPYRQMLPSLMFLLGDRQRTQRFKFLRNFFSHLLFFLQLLAVVLLSLVAAEPTLSREFEAQSSHTVFVIDTSASMQAPVSGTTSRFEAAVSEAKGHLTKTNTIITAGEPSKALLVRASASEARRELNVLRADESPTALAEAILLANDQLGSDSGRILVLSDFAQKDTSAVLLAKQTAADENTALSFLQMGQDVPNIGFIAFDPEPGRLRAKVRNFNQKPAEITVSYKQEDKVIDTRTFTLAPLSEEGISFVAEEGKSTLALESSSDGFSPDNALYATIPAESQVSILIVTNAQTTTFLEQALLATGKAKLRRAIPPVVPDFSPYDIVILHQFDENILLPGTFEDLKRYREGGGGVILTENQKLSTLDTVELLPVTITGSKTTSTPVSAGITHPLTADTEFGEATHYLSAALKPGALLIAKAQDDTAIIALKDNVLYYGLAEDKSSFHTKLSYPIFWLNVLNALHQGSDSSSLHLTTGTVLPLGQERGEGPQGKTAEGYLVMSKSGYYKRGETTLAANLVDAEESTINAEESFVSLIHEGESEGVTSAERTNLEGPLIVLGGLLLLTEWLILKRRGTV